MIIHVWLIYKKGEPRVYTRTTEPPDDLARKWRDDGFKIYQASVFLPGADVTEVDAVVRGIAVPVESPDGK